MLKLTQDKIDLINKPLPKEAITTHPTKTYLSSIKSIYVTERLNEVFWFGWWTLKVKHQETWEKWMVVVHVIFEAPEYWFYYECFGWNDNGWENSKNFDLWDAYKWATTDAISKIASWIWIWADVYRWKAKADNKVTDTTTTPAPRQYTGWTQTAWFNKKELEMCIAEDNAFSKEAIEQWAIDEWYKLSWPSRVMIDKYLNSWEL